MGFYSSASIFLSSYHAVSHPASMLSRQRPYVLVAGAGFLYDLNLWYGNGVFFYMMMLEHSKAQRETVGTWTPDIEWCCESQVASSKYLEKKTINAL